MKNGLDDNKGAHIKRVRRIKLQTGIRGNEWFVLLLRALGSSKLLNDFES